MRTSVVALFVVLVSSGSVAAAPGAPPIEPCMDVATCLARCARNIANACIRAGELYGDMGQSERVEATTTKIDKALGKLCDAKNARACMVGGDLHCNAAASDGAGGYGNCSGPANARFQKGCELGDGAACAYTGMLALKGIGGEVKDAARAKSFLDKAWLVLEDACNDGSASACMSIGLYRASDRFGTPDKAAASDGIRRAVPLVARDCAAGDGRACWYVKLVYDNGLGVKANADRAEAARKKLCKLAPKAEECKTTNIGTIGTGPGGAPGPIGPKPGAPTITIGQPSANGSLDKAIIRRYIKREHAKVSYCYEKQLLDKPGLAGTVNASFVIDANGAVESSQASGLPPVDSCVADVIKRIQFPKPQGGGKVQVNYPFTFRPADAPMPKRP